MDARTVSSRVMVQVCLLSARWGLKIKFSYVPSLLIRGALCSCRELGFLLEGKAGPGLGHGDQHPLPAGDGSGTWTSPEAHDIHADKTLLSPGWCQWGVAVHATLLGSPVDGL